MSLLELEFTLMQLPDVLITRVFSNDALSDADRANARCACTQLRDLVEFITITVKSVDKIASAIASARGRCETINLDPTTPNITAAHSIFAIILDQMLDGILAVGKAHPELVARLRTVNVPLSSTPTVTHFLSSCNEHFPALKTIQFPTVVENSPMKIIMDPRVKFNRIYIFGNVESHVVGIFENIAHKQQPIRNITIALGDYNIRKLIRLDIERTRNAGLRVHTLHVYNLNKEYVDDWDRLCTAALPLATNSLSIMGHISPSIVCHINRGVKHITLHANIGLFAAMEQHFPPYAGVHLSLSIQKSLWGGGVWKHLA